MREPPELSLAPAARTRAWLPVEAAGTRAERWASTGLAALLTLVALASIGTAGRDWSGALTAAAPPPAEERVRYVAPTVVPPLAPPLAPPLVGPSAGSAPVTAPAARTPQASGIALPLPFPAAPRDSTGGSTRAAPPTGAVIPSVRELAPAPCALRGCAVTPPPVRNQWPGQEQPLTADEARARLGATMGAVAAHRGDRIPLSAAERDSMARLATIRAVQGAVASPSAAQPTGGMSIPVGLPGGGPSAAQRKRDRALDADIRARLERIRTRPESLAIIRRDSIERDSLARARRATP